MNPHQKNKIDVSSLSPEEQRLFRLYGKLPSQKDRFMKNKLGERKYFDSGDYAMNKAGKGDGMETGHVGSEHPDPESIRHGSVVSPVTAGTPVVPTLNKSGSVSAGTAGSIPVGSPAKESGLQRETSVEDAAEESAIEEPKDDSAAAAVADGDGSVTQAIPIRS